MALRESCLTRPTRNTLCRRRLSEGRVAVFFRIGVRLAAGVVLLRTARRTGLRPLLSASRPFFGFHGVAALPGGAGSVPTLGQRQPQSRSRSFVTALNGFTSPRPNPAALAAPGSQLQTPYSFPCSPSPPRAAPGGGPPAKALSCGPRQPAPGRRFTVPQASCGTARAALNPGSTAND